MLILVLLLLLLLLLPLLLLLALLQQFIYYVFLIIILRGPSRAAAASEGPSLLRNSFINACPRCRGTESKGHVQAQGKGQVQPYGKAEEGFFQAPQASERKIFHMAPCPQAWHHVLVGRHLFGRHAIGCIPHE